MVSVLSVAVMSFTINLIVLLGGLDVTTAQQLYPMGVCAKEGANFQLIFRGGETEADGFLSRRKIMGEEGKTYQ